MVEWLTANVRQSPLGLPPLPFAQRLASLMRIQFRSSAEFNPSLLSALAPFRGPDLDELAIEFGEPLFKQ